MPSNRVQNSGIYKIQIHKGFNDIPERLPLARHGPQLNHPSEVFLFRVHKHATEGEMKNDQSDVSRHITCVSRSLYDVFFN